MDKVFDSLLDENIDEFVLRILSSPMEDVSKIEPPLGDTSPNVLFSLIRRAPLSKNKENLILCLSKLLEAGFSPEAQGCDAFISSLRRNAENDDVLVSEFFLGTFARRFFSKSVNETKSPTGTDYLFSAMRTDSVQLVSSLLDLGCSPTAKSPHGWTPLMLARTPEMAKLLLAAGADLSVVSDDGRTVFSEWHAMKKSMPKKLHDEMMSLFVSDGVSPSVLVSAAKIGVGAISPLLKRAKNIDDRCLSSGDTPLLGAIGTDKEKVVRLLLDKGASVAGEKGREAINRVQISSSGWDILCQIVDKIGHWSVDASLLSSKFSVLPWGFDKIMSVSAHFPRLSEDDSRIFLDSLREGFSRLSQMGYQKASMFFVDESFSSSPSACCIKNLESFLDKDELERFLDAMCLLAYSESPSYRGFPAEILAERVVKAGWSSEALSSLPPDKSERLAGCVAEIQAKNLLSRQKSALLQSNSLRTFI